MESSISASEMSEGAWLLPPALDHPPISARRVDLELAGRLRGGDREREGAPRRGGDDVRCAFRARPEVEEVLAVGGAARDPLEVAEGDVDPVGTGAANVEGAGSTASWPMASAMFENRV